MSADAEHDLLDIANLVDRHIPDTAPGFASRPAFLMGPGQRRKNVRSAARIALALVAVVAMTQLYRAMTAQDPVQLLWLLVLLLATSLASVGMARDHPRVLRGMTQVIELGPWLILVLVLVGAVSSGLVVVLANRSGDRFSGLAFLTAFVLLTRTALAQPGAGSLRARRLRRTLVAYASFLLWVVSGLWLVYTLVVLIPSTVPDTATSDPAQRLYRAVGFLVLVAGYSAAVLARQRRQRAGLADALDAVLVGIAYLDGQGLKDLSLNARKLDRCLSSGSDTPAVLRSPFESLGIRVAVQVLLRRASGCHVLDMGEEAQVAEVEVRAWTRGQARHALTTYLSALRADVTRAGEPFV